MTTGITTRPMRHTSTKKKYPLTLPMPDGQPTRRVERGVSLHRGPVVA
jgi:hypothetical protein